MTEWYDGLAGIEQFLLGIAVFSTLIFMIQLCLSLIGIAGDDLDFDSDVGDGGFEFGEIFTLRNGVSFLMGFSWGGLMAYDWGFTYSLFVAIVGFAVGAFFVAVNIFLLIAMSRLRHEGNINLENAIDEEGRVTLGIPSARSGVGKVMVPIQGRLKELHAVTDGEALDKNSAVRILDFSGSQLIVASRTDKEQ